MLEKFYTGECIQEKCILKKVSWRMYNGDVGECIVKRAFWRVYSEEVLILGNVSWGNVC